MNNKYSSFNLYLTIIQYTNLFIRTIFTQLCQSSAASDRKKKVYILDIYLYRIGFPRFHSSKLPLMLILVLKLQNLHTIQKTQIDQTTSASTNTLGTESWATTTKKITKNIKNRTTIFTATVIFGPTFENENKFFVGYFTMIRFAISK